MTPQDPGAIPGGIPLPVVEPPVVEPPVVQPIAHTDRRVPWTAVAIQIVLLVIAFLVAIIAIVLYSTVATSNTSEVIGLLSLFGAAAALSGASFGFLFGVPRTLATPANDGSSGSGATLPNITGDATLPNTNLEQISDWLTKIIVGATLTQLGNIPPAAGNLFGQMGAALGSPPPPSAAAFSGALVIYSALVGFILGWLTTRVWLGPLIYRIGQYFK